MIYDILKIFDNISDLNKEDKLSSFLMSFYIEDIIQITQLKVIEDIVNKIPSRDKVDIQIDLSTDDYIIIRKDFDEVEYVGPSHITSNKNIESIFTQLKLAYIDGEKIKLTIKIDKEYNRGFISIYDFDIFMKWFFSKDVESIISMYSTLYKDNSRLNFISYQNKDLLIETDTFIISSINNKKIINNNINKEKIIKKSKELTNYQIEQLSVIPQDFNVNNYKYEESKYKNMLLAIRDILSIIFISNFSNMSLNTLSFKISGYRVFEEEINTLNLLNENSTGIIYKVYEWVYNDNNTSDKLSIARNILSLHCRYQGIFLLKNDTFEAIESNFNYYLKTNTDNFLEEKKNLSLLIIEESKYLSESLERFISNMTKNLLGYFTFMAALIITNTIGNGNFIDIFQEDVVNIFFISIFISFGFLIISYVETNNKYKKVEYYMNDLIQGYGILLGVENVKSQINGTESYEKVKKSYKSRQKLYSFIWIIINIILFLFLDWISGDILILGIINFI